MAQQPVINKAPAEVNEFLLTCASLSGAITFTEKTTIQDLIKVQQQIHDSISLLTTPSKLGKQYLSTLCNLKTPPEKFCLYANVGLPDGQGMFRVSLFKAVLSARPVSETKAKYDAEQPAAQPAAQTAGKGKARTTRMSVLDLKNDVENFGYSMLCAMFDLIKKFWLHNTKHMDIASKPAEFKWPPTPGELSTKLVTAINATFKTVWGEDPDTPGKPPTSEMWRTKMWNLINSTMKHPKKNDEIVFDPQARDFFAPVEFDASANTGAVVYFGNPNVGPDVLLGGARIAKDKVAVSQFYYLNRFKNEEKSKWLVDPFKILQKLGSELAEFAKAEAKKASNPATRGIETPSPISLRYLIDVLYPDVDDGEPTSMMMNALAKGGITNTNQLFSLDRDAWVAKGLPIGIYNRSRCDLDEIYTQHE